MKRNSENSLATLILIGLILVTCFVYTKSVSDPVNAPKLLVLGILITGMLGVMGFKRIRQTFQDFKITSIFLIAFTLCLVNAVVNSDSPISQNIYGVQGRNTGFLTFFGVSLLFFGILSINRIQNLEKIFLALFISALINVIYGIWVLAFGDFIGWNNQYKVILGTFGNPNFVSSFLGLATIATMPRLKTLSIYLRFIVTLLIAVAIFEIWKSNSIQGFVVVGIGLFIFSLIWLYYRVRFRRLFYSLGFIGLGISPFLMFGALGNGPFGRYLYQETLSFRIEYWKAGINMGLSFPFTGVGLDSYGDWYRQFRSSQALIRPGVDVVTNVAHNIYIDYFASGGFPLIISVLGINFIVLKSALNQLRSSAVFDPLLVSLFVTWVGFQAQAIISINQIGLGIWGWVLSALILSRERFCKNSSKINATLDKEKKRYLSDFPRFLFGGFLGLIIFLPPVSADHKWTSAFATRDAMKIFDSLRYSYFNPQNSYTLATAIQIFESSGLNDQALALARQATEFNPRSYDAWLLTSNLKLVSPLDRANAIKQMQKLDPKNFKLND